MENTLNWIRIGAAAVGAFFGGLLGGMDGLLYTLLVFVALDYGTGLTVAIINKKVSSEIGAKGIAKKVFIFVLVGVGHVLDSHVIGTGSMLRSATIMFYLANEGISLLENAANIGLPIPEKLKDALAQLNDKEDKQDE